MRARVHSRCQDFQNRILDVRVIDVLEVILRAGLALGGKLAKQKLQSQQILFAIARVGNTVFLQQCT